MVIMNLDRSRICCPGMSTELHSFKTRSGHRPGPVTGSRVRWVDPGQPKKKNTYIKHLTN